MGAAAPVYCVVGFSSPAAIPSRRGFLALACARSQARAKIDAAAFCAGRALVRYFGSRGARASGVFCYP